MFNNFRGPFTMPRRLCVKPDDAALYQSLIDHQPLFLSPRSRARVWRRVRPRCYSGRSRRRWSRRRCRTKLCTVSASSVEIPHVVSPTPDDHFATSPDCAVMVSRIRRVEGGDCCPTVHARIVSATTIKNVAVIGSTPDNHFAASPNRCVKSSALRHVGDTGGRPTI
jgi:hypothetical protein